MKILILFLFCLLSFGQLQAEIERRAAIDVGSGGTKVIIADVNKESNKILEVFFEESFSVPYQASLDKSSDGTFDQETKKLGLKTFREIKEITEHYAVQKIAAIATAAFRKSNNSEAFIKEIKKETGISIQMISPRKEGEIAFFSAQAVSSFDPKEIIVWDIGTGSLQMTTKNDDETGLIVYSGENMGSISFKSYIIDTIQEKEENSPNPISDEELQMADRYARAFGRKAYPVIKQKIQNQAPVIGIGRLFVYSILPVASQNGVITRSSLRSFIQNSLNKSDQELDNPYAHVDVSNCILTLAIMKALHIQEIHPQETTSTKGLLVYSDFWD